MDAQLFEKFVPGAVFMASIMGSPHCLTMCGPLAGAYGRKPLETVGYHWGRLLAYLSLGALAGLFGSRVLSAEGMDWLSKLAALWIAYAFVLMGVRLIRGQGVHFFKTMKIPFFYRLHEFARGNAFLGGLLSAFLPCGWLHVFVLGAATLGSVWEGAAVLFVFWLGTLPVFASLPALRRWVLGPFATRAPKLAGVLLIAGGIAVVVARFAPPPAHGSAGHGVETAHGCH